jgi:hypothetical protein
MKTAMFLTVHYETFPRTFKASAGPVLPLLVCESVFFISNFLKAPEIFTSPSRLI